MNGFSIILALIYLYFVGLMPVFAFTDFQEEFLKLHNKIREKHKVPPLKLSQELCDYAKERAEAFANQGELSSLPDKLRKFGESVFRQVKKVAEDTKEDAKKIIDSWYQAAKDFNFKQGIRSGGAEYFTQMVWKKTEELGVGVAHKDGNQYIVANYKPSGNVPGEYEDNVFPSMFSAGILTLVNIKILIINFLIVNTFAFI